MSRDYDSAEKFFVRGNLALDWEHVARWANYVAIDANGVARAHSENPLQDDMGSGCKNEIIGLVGEECPDWLHLVFKRPQSLRLPDVFWEAVDVVFGNGVTGDKLMYAAINFSGNCVVFDEEPRPDSKSLAWERESGRQFITQNIISNGIDWRNSLTRRPNLEIGKH